MSNLRIIAKNEVDNPACVLSVVDNVGSPLTPTLSVDYLKNMSRGLITRIARSDPGFSIRGTYGGATITASGMSLTRQNMIASSTNYQFVTYPNANWTGAPTADSGGIMQTARNSLTTGAPGIDPLYWFPSCSLKSWELKLSAGAASPAYIDASRLIVGDYFELAYNPVYGGTKVGAKEGTQQWITDDGGVHCDASGQYKIFPFDLQGIPEADRAMWMKILYYVGMRKDVLVSLYPSGTSDQLRDYTINGVFQSLPDLSIASLGRDNTTIVLREA